MPDCRPLWPCAHWHFTELPVSPRGPAGNRLPDLRTRGHSAGAVQLDPCRSHRFAQAIRQDKGGRVSFL